MIYDVTVPLEESVVTYPGDPPYRRTLAAALPKDSCNTSRLDFGAHTATHVDAPLHMMAGGSDVAQFPAESLVGRARVIEISDPRAVTLSELKGKWVDGTVRVLLKTRNSTLWNKGSFQSDFVYIEPAAAEFVAEQEIQLLGFDYLSIEKPSSPGHPTHLALMKKKIVILEGLNLERVPSGEYVIFCGPLKLKGSDGAPARVFLADQETVGLWWKQF